ncbi:hypothetical protein CYLTODRAFT_425342, partial [Cylindrobasidium torrendii FP15055 ss-10]
MSHLAPVCNVRETLFTTNQAPSQQEMHIIDATLVQLHANLDTYLSQNVLDARIADTAAYILRLKSTRAPMRYIPDDILALIFEYATPWCLADGIAEHSFPPRMEGSLGAPWTLSHVCRNWRALSLSLPRLWSVFRTSFSELYDPQRAERIDLIYQRSGPMTLRLYIKTPYIENYWKDPVPLTFTPRWRCLKFTHRWRCVRIDPPVHRTEFHEDILDRHFPSLTHLSLHLPPEYSLTAVVSAPFLHDLELLFALTHCDLVLPWDQITRFKSVAASNGFLDMMENLEEIVIEETTENNYSIPDEPDDEGSNCSKVRRLVHNNRYCDPGFEIYNQLFALYNFASLHTLVIIASNCTDDESDYPLCSFSLPSVVELSLSIGEADYMRNIFIATPNVQSLHLEGKGNLDLVLCSRSPRPTSTVAMLRRLKHLSLTLRLGRDDSLMDLDALDAAFSTLKLKGVPLETMSFYSGFLREGNTVSEGEWIAHIQEEMAESLNWWMHWGLRAFYKYNAEQRFSKR